MFVKVLTMLLIFLFYKHPSLIFVAIHVSLGFYLALITNRSLRKEFIRDKKNLIIPLILLLIACLTPFSSTAVMTQFLISAFLSKLCLNMITK